MHRITTNLLTSLRDNTTKHRYHDLTIIIYIQYLHHQLAARNGLFLSSPFDQYKQYLFISIYPFFYLYICIVYMQNYKFKTEDES